MKKLSKNTLQRFDPRKYVTTILPKKIVENIISTADSNSVPNLREIFTKSFRNSQDSMRKDVINQKKNQEIFAQFKMDISKLATSIDQMPKLSDNNKIQSLFVSTVSPKVTTNATINGNGVAVTNSNDIVSTFVDFSKKPSDAKTQKLSMALTDIITSVPNGKFRALTGRKRTKAQKLLDVMLNEAGKSDVQIEKEKKKKGRPLKVNGPYEPEELSEKFGYFIRRKVLGKEESQIDYSKFQPNTLSEKFGYKVRRVLEQKRRAKIKPTIEAPEEPLVTLNYTDLLKKAKKKREDQLAARKLAALGLDYDNATTGTSLVWKVIGAIIGEEALRRTLTNILRRPAVGAIPENGKPTPKPSEKVTPVEEKPTPKTTPVEEKPTPKQLKQGSKLKNAFEKFKVGKAGNFLTKSLRFLSPIGDAWTAYEMMKFIYGKQLEDFNYPPDQTYPLAEKLDTRDIKYWMKSLNMELISVIKKKKELERSKRETNEEKQYYIDLVNREQYLNLVYDSYQKALQTGKKSDIIAPRENKKDYDYYENQEDRPNPSYNEEEQPSFVPQSSILKKGITPASFTASPSPIVSSIGEGSASASPVSRPSYNPFNDAMSAFGNRMQWGNNNNQTSGSYGTTNFKGSQIPGSFKNGGSVTEHFKERKNRGYYQGKSGKNETYVEDNVPNAKILEGVSGNGGYAGATIAKGEGGYGSFNRGIAGDARGAKIDFSKMTIGDIMKKQSGGPRQRELFAVGKYQIIPSTMKEAVKALKIDKNTKFTPEVQERIFREYLIANKRRAVKDYITGKTNDLNAAVMATSQEFASVGVPYDTTDYKGRMIRRGQTYYGGSGGNRASTSPAAIEAAYKKEREQYNEMVKNGLDPDTAWTNLSGHVIPQKQTKEEIAKEKEEFGPHESKYKMGPQQNDMMKWYDARKRLNDKFQVGALKEQDFHVKAFELSKLSPEEREYKKFYGKTRKEFNDEKIKRMKRDNKTFTWRQDDYDTFGDMGRIASPEKFREAVNKMPLDDSYVENRQNQYGPYPKKEKQVEKIEPTFDLPSVPRIPSKNSTKTVNEKIDTNHLFLPPSYQKAMSEAKKVDAPFTVSSQGLPTPSF